MLDLGSGAGADVLISARRVGPTGKAIGLDMTDEMLELARANAAEAGVENVEFLKGYLEEMPLADESVDVVISNCVINLSGDKPQVLREAARVLRPGGRFAVSDVIADPDMDEATRADMAAWTGCIAGALTEAEFRAALESAGFEEIEIRETHRVHEHAAAAIIRARKPLARKLAEESLLPFSFPRERSPSQDRRLRRASKSSKLAGPGSPRLGRFDSFAASWCSASRFQPTTWLPLAGSSRQLRDPSNAGFGSGRPSNPIFGGAFPTSSMLASGAGCISM